MTRFKQLDILLRGTCTQIYLKPITTSTFCDDRADFKSVHDGFSNQPKEIRIKIRRLVLYKFSWKSKFKVNNFYVLVIVICRRAKTIAKGLEHHASEKLLFTQILIVYVLSLESGFVVCGQCVWNLSLNADFNTFRRDQGLFHMFLYTS